MSSHAPRYQIVDRTLLQMLMNRTGTGASVSIRELAMAARVPHGTIGNLLSGHQRAVNSVYAHRIANSIGVDVLVLFTPEGRSTRRPAESVAA